MLEPCPSDLTDPQWDIVKSLISHSHVGQPRVVEIPEASMRSYHSCEQCGDTGWISSQRCSRRSATSAKTEMKSGTGAADTGS